jgi:amino acid transporter
MQPELMLAVLTVWLFILWFGSIALEATGMERKKARFQALSALTGTGFTTREAEDIVGHPRRRLIATWLMFLGSVGIILFLLIFLVIILVGIKPAQPMSPVIIILSALPPLALMVLFWLGVLDKLGTKIANWMKRSAYFTAELSSREIVHQSGDYSVARLTIGIKAPEVGCKISDTSLAKHKITILAIERGDKTLAFPEAKETVLAGDHLLCYGKTAEISRILK